jgi:1-acyl-sn-glycerol-3-phosphate acyltransferase
MPDAEVIPLGTRGRPGRGSGNAKPSSAARNLATPRKKPAAAPRPPAAGQDAEATPKPAPKPAPTRAPKPVPRSESAPEQTAVSAAEQSPVTEAGPKPDRSATGAHEATGSPTGGPGPTGSAPDEPGASGQVPGDGIPPWDWVEALTAAAVEVFGESWEPRIADFRAFLRRRLDGDYSVDEYGFDAEVTERFLLSTLRPIADKWFRVEVRGAENIPAEGGALVVSNHSGTIPMDGLMTMVSIHDHTGRNLRPLGADLVFRLPVIGELARKSGATLACNEDAQRMLSHGELVGVWPEGFKGIGKPYSERYKLQRFGRGGFVSTAMRTGVPIIPCSVVGAEEIYPLVGNMPALARLLGVPYIPITPFFPWLGLLGLVPLPSKWLIEFGEPIRTDSFDEGAADDPMLVFNVTDQVRETIQQTLYSLLVQRRTVFH